MEPSVTSLIVRLREGDRSALDRLIPIVYNELHHIASGYMRREDPDHTLQPTALINEVYMRLMGKDEPVNFQNRSHFIGLSACLMRQILVDHARTQHAAKRGSGAPVLPLNEALDFSPERASSVVAIDDALKALAKIDEEKARLVELRFFGGMTAEEIAEHTGISPHRVRHQVRLALAWLHREAGHES